MPKITLFLWFEKRAEDAAMYYLSVFKNSKITRTTYYPKSNKVIPTAPEPGSVLTVEFEIDGLIFVALNGGKVPGFELSPAISFAVDCKDQAEIDYLWGKLSAVPEAEQCGWCRDKFGVTWQIVPNVLTVMLADKDQVRVERVIAAYLPMKKFVIADLERAYEGR
jgi:predicted 3-demethylubiquinone-9 3-methyltransferase (glyoxalase superfamily)